MSVLTKIKNAVSRTKPSDDFDYEGEPCRDLATCESADPCGACGEYGDDGFDYAPILGTP